MAWERRSNGQATYFATTTRRPGGRRVRQYYGTGPIADLAATMAAQRRAERESRARAERAETERWQSAVAPLLELCRAADLMLRAALLARGYRQHYRGEWRRARDGRQA
jgi:hypothetical protein